MTNTRELLKALADSLADALEGGGHDAEYYDQDNAPLPKTTYLRLVRRGVLAGYKVHGRVFVKRAVLHAYVEQHPMQRHPGLVTSQDDEATELDRLLGQNRRRAS